MKLYEFIQPSDNITFYAKAGALDSIYDLARAALSAPARNCDVGTAHEQYVRFEKHCNRKWKDYTNTDMRRPFPCGRNDTTNNPCARCFATWAQMPFAPAEGGDHA